MADNKDNSKFFKTVITVTVVSQGAPVEPDFSLEDLAYEIFEGEYSGAYGITDVKEITKEECKALLVEQHTDPDLFDDEEDPNSA